jgi:hypothetical protein
MNIKKERISASEEGWQIIKRHCRCVRVACCVGKLRPIELCGGIMRKCVCSGGGGRGRVASQKGEIE